MSLHLFVCFMPFVVTSSAELAQVQEQVQGYLKELGLHGGDE